VPRVGRQARRDRVAEHEALKGAITALRSFVELQRDLNAKLGDSVRALELELGIAPRRPPPLRLVTGDEREEARQAS